MSVVSRYFPLPKYELSDPGVSSCASQGPNITGISYQDEVSSSCSFSAPVVPKIEPAPSPENVQYQSSPSSSCSQLPTITLPAAYNTTPPYHPPTTSSFHSSPDPTPSYITSHSPYPPTDLSPQQTFTPTHSSPGTVSPAHYPALSYPPAEYPSPYLAHPPYTYTKAESTRMYPTDQCKAPTDVAPWKSEVQYPGGSLVGRVGELMEAGDMEKLVELIWTLPPPSHLDDETIFRAHIYVAFYTRQYLQVD